MCIEYYLPESTSYFFETVNEASTYSFPLKTRYREMISTFELSVSLSSWDKSEVDSPCSVALHSFAFDPVPPAARYLISQLLGKNS